MLNLQSIYFGQRHKNFDYKDWAIIKKISRLAHKHHQQCENNCNGEGYINGKFYRCDGSTAGTYIGDETIFNIESTKIENKTIAIISERNKEINNLEKKGPFTVEFQGDPRGATVKIYYEGDFIEL